MCSSDLSIVTFFRSSFTSIIRDISPIVLNHKILSSDYTSEFAVYGALRLGAIVAEHNPLAPAEELRAQLERHGGRVVVAWEKGVDLIVDPRSREAGAAGPEADSVDPLGGRTVFSVDLSAALPAHLRAALRLPVARAREARDSMRAPRLPAGVRSWDWEASRAEPIPTS